VTDASELPSTMGTNEVAAAVKCNPQTLCRMQAPGAPGADRYPQHAFRVGRSFRWHADAVARFMSGAE
jgi:hypothetical protein